MCLERITVVEFQEQENKLLTIIEKINDMTVAKYQLEFIYKEQKDL